MILRIGYWLKFIKKMGLDKSDELEFALRESNELISIFVSSIETAKKNESK